MIQLVCIQARIHAHPERLIHDPIRLRSTAGEAMRDIPVGGLSEQVAPEHQARVDFVSVQMPDHFSAGDTRFLTDRDRKAEPAGVAMGGRFRQDQTILQVL
jgi:hypothetical protein